MSRARSVVGVVLVAVCLAASTAWASEEEKPLSNAEVIKLTQASLGDAVILALVKSAKDVQFDLRADELVRLTEAGVSKAVLAAMIERAGQRGAAATGSGGPRVVLRAGGAETDLVPMDGDVETIVAPFVGTRRFVIFSEVAAKARTRDRRPSLVAATDKEPRKGWWFVKLEQDTDKEDMNRSIDVESPGMWGGVSSSAPEDDFKIDFNMVEESPGLWRFSPRKDLKPGEYGLYIAKGEHTLTLYDFGVDK